jgi:hypothetical protein
MQRVASSILSHHTNRVYSYLLGIWDVHSVKSQSNKINTIVDDDPADPLVPIRTIQEQLIPLARKRDDIDFFLVSQADVSRSISQPH